MSESAKTGRVFTFGSRRTAGACCPLATKPTIRPGRGRQRRMAASARAARSSRGPIRAASSGRSDTTPTEASTAEPTDRVRLSGRSDLSDGDGRGEDRHDRHGEPVGAGLQLPVGGDHAGLTQPPGKNRAAGCPLVEPVPGTRAVGDVEVGPRRLDDDERERLVALGDGEVCGCSHGVGELSQHRARLRPHDRRDGRREAADAEREPHPTVVGPCDEVVRLERRHEPIDDGPAHAQRCGELRHGQTGGITCGCEGFEDPYAAVEGLRRLRPWWCSAGRHPLIPRSGARGWLHPVGRGPGTRTWHTPRRRRPARPRRAPGVGRCRP